MKRFLIPLLAAVALPSAVNAESHWLIIRESSYGDYFDLVKIEMESAEACIREGKKWKDLWPRFRSYYCIAGK